MDILDAVQAGADGDEKGLLRRIAHAIDAHASESDRTGAIPDGLFADLDVRLLNTMLLPVQYGGMPSLSTAMARSIGAELLGYAGIGLSLAMPGPGLALPPIMALANSEQKRHWLSRFDCDRPVWGAFAISEPDSGSDAIALRTTAVDCGRFYLLNGTKCFITNGARADFVVVFATVNASLGRFGIRAFVVERDTPGFAVDRLERMIGLRSSQLAVLSFRDCMVPKENQLFTSQLGRVYDAFAGAQAAWDYMRPLLAVAMVGAARRMRDAMIEAWSDGRSERGGRVPSEAVAEMTHRIAAARLLCHKACWRYDRKMKSTREACMAKSYAAQTAAFCARTALQTIGAASLIGNTVLERGYRDIKAFDIIEGTTEIQRMIITRLQQNATADFMDPYTD